MRNANNGKDRWLPSSAAEAAKVVGAYALFGGLWILFSDRLLLSLSPDPAFYHSFQTYKGWFYVGATAILLYFLILRSMERTRRLEEEKRQSELKLLQAQKMEIVGRLAGGITHDFNNILTAIMSLSQLTAKNLPEGDPRRADVEDITRFSEKAAAITRQLLVFSRKRESQPRPLDPGETLRNAGSMLRRASGEKIKLGISAGPGLRPISADPGQLEQALMNLAVNARDAMPEGGTLELSAVNVELKEPLAAIERELPPGDYVALSARDSGVGMDRATMERLFEPFFTTKEQGTGLGLAIVNRIVTVYGGTLNVDSVPGRGTLFTVKLPASA
ncbi:MAG: ATP-binding protein, partial [Elusimicrobiales bacterium]|nr:ATP-binding protein [Elusimicrobiales bacterium]